MPVILNLFLAPEFVFIFGISFLIKINISEPKGRKPFDLEIHSAKDSKDLYKIT